MWGPVLCEVAGLQHPERNDRVSNAAVIPHEVAESSGAAVDSATALRAAQNDSGGIGWCGYAVREPVLCEVAGLQHPERNDRASNATVIPCGVAESSGVVVDSASALRAAQNDKGGAGIE